MHHEAPRDKMIQIIISHLEQLIGIDAMHTSLVANHTVPELPLLSQGMTLYRLDQLIDDIRYIRVLSLNKAGKVPISKVIQNSVVGPQILMPIGINRNDPFTIFLSERIETAILKPLRTFGTFLLRHVTHTNPRTEETERNILSKDTQQTFNSPLVRVVQ